MRARPGNTDSSATLVESSRREPQRMLAVQSPVIPIVAELIAKTPGTVSLGQGVVSYGPPAEALELLPRFLADPDNHKYKPVQGIPALLEAMRRKLATENGLALTGDNALLVTAGGNLAFMNAVLAITDPGDEAILQVPYYFNHEMALTLANCRPVLVETDDSYQLRVDAIERAITPRTRAVVTISPNNPTGAVYPAHALREVNELCRARGIYHINDEAYEYFTYDGARHFSPASLPDAAAHTISLYSLSKAYGFASWRIGYMVVPEHLVVSVKKIQDTILICAPVISQWAAVGALAAGRSYCQAKLKDIAATRELFLGELGRLKRFCRVPSAAGAFYLLLQLETDWPSMELTKRLIQDFRVAVIPGTAFGIEKTCHLRVAYGALPRASAGEAISRLVRGLEQLVGK